jgi:hypothetical protein
MGRGVLLGTAAAKSDEHQRKEMKMLEPIDFKTLETVYGGQDFSKGQSFEGQMFPGAPSFIPGGSSEVYMERAEKADAVRQNLTKAGFGITEHPPISGQPLVGGYTATCGRSFCQWNG